MSREVVPVAPDYRSIVELAPDGIVMLDEDGTILFVNPALARMVGASDPSELIGRNQLELVHPDDHDVARAHLAELRSGRVVEWTAKTFLRLDGTPVSVECTMVPFRSGDRVVMQGFVRDVTERLEAEAILEASRRRLQALFDTAHDAILFFDSDSRFVAVNPAAAALLGATQREILGHRVGDFSPPQSPGTADVLREMQERGRIAGEAVLQRKDGTLREVEYRIVGNVLPGLHVSVVRDITERKEAERAVQSLSGRLLQSQDDERRRIGRELHDTTAQNLVAIRLNLARLSKRLKDASAAVAECLNESIELTDQSISEIRTLSYVLHPPLIDEAGLATALRWYVYGFERRSGIKVELEIPEDLPRDRPHIETAAFRIVQEALTNILRHSGSSVARIRVLPLGNGMRLEIEDQGRGLPESLRSDEDALLASGLGMAGIRQRARESGGHVTIQSTDRGTTLTVELPHDAGSSHETDANPDRG